MQSDEIAGLEDRRYAAMLAHDLATLAALFDEDLLYTHSSGLRDDKATYLKGLTDGVYRYHKIEVFDRTIRLHGETALVFAHTITALTTLGVDKTIDNMILAVWVRRSAGWRFVAYQPTLLPARPAA
jgi:ketosteroid isomerase-like protein